MSEQTEMERKAGEALERTLALYANASKGIREWAAALAEIMAPLAKAVGAICGEWRVMGMKQKPHRWAYRRKAARFAGHRRWPGKRQRRGG